MSAFQHESLDEDGRMLRTRRVLVLVLLAVAGMLCGLRLLEPAPPRINVRWAERATTAARVREGAVLHLDAPEPKGERTWSYRLLDDSPAGITAIVAHPLVDDTAGIDRGTLTLSPEFPPVRAGLRRIYRSWPVRAFIGWLLPLATVCAVIGLALTWSSVRNAFKDDPARMALVVILGLSLCLRWALAFSGGQLYWPDEERYLTVRVGVAAAVAHDRDGVARAFDEPAHVLFKVIAVLPAAVELLRGDDTRIAAMFFALFSVLNVWLVALAARRLDAGRTVSFVAASLFAMSTSFFYYSRHLFPYDVATTFALLALVVGSAHPAGWRQSVGCGVLAACAFLAYAGYWILGGAVCVIHVCDASNVRNGVRRALLAGVGLLGTLAVTLLIYRVGGASPVDKLIAFASDADQGNIAEGWRLPWEYLWHSEHGLLLLWLVCLLWCAVAWRDVARVRVVRAGLLGVVFTYAALVSFSVVLDEFAVYGRLARQIVPFFCLLSASVTIRAWRACPDRQRTPLTLVAVLVLVIQATLNFNRPLRQEFPREFLLRAEAAVARAGAQEPAIVYAHHLFPTPKPFTMAPGSVIVAQAAHPLQFLPYQYEGFTPNQRDVLRSSDIRMRMILPPAGAPTGIY